MADYHITLDNSHADILKSTGLASRVVSGTDLPVLVENARMSIQFPAVHFTEIDNAPLSDASRIFVFPTLDDQKRITVRAGIQSSAGYINATEVASPDVKFLSDLAGLHAKNQGIFRKVYFSVDELKNLIKDPSGNLKFYLTSLSYKDDTEHHLTLSAVFEDEQGNPGTEGLVSALPCPPNCGSDGPYENRNLEIVNL